MGSKFRDIQQMTAHRRLGDVLRTSWVRPETTSQGCPLDVRLGRLLVVISRYPEDLRSRRQFGTSPGWSNRIFRGRPWEVGGGRPED